MSNKTVEQYRKVLDAKEILYSYYDKLKKEEYKLYNMHKHEWFWVSEKVGEFEYYCPICEKNLLTKEKKEDVTLNIIWALVLRAILRNNIDKANEAIEEIYKKRRAYLCDLQNFSKVIEKYGYKIDVDTAEIEVID